MDFGKPLHEFGWDNVMMSDEKNFTNGLSKNDCNYEALPEIEQLNTKENWASLRKKRALGINIKTQWFKV